MTYETVRQWAERGRRGVVLETLLVGGTRMTTRRAFDRFLSRLNHRPGPSGGGARTTALPAAPPPASGGRRSRGSPRNSRNWG